MKENKRKNRVALGIWLGIIVLLFAGAGTVLYFGIQNMNNVRQTKVPKQEGEVTTINEIPTFADWTSIDVFDTVPAVISDTIQVGDPVDYGSENYIIDLNNCSFVEYKDYMALLEKAGFAKFADNGEKGIEEVIYTSSFTREDITVTVTYVSVIEKAFITACRDLPLSEHLIYKPEYKEGIISGKKTKVHMLDMREFGSSFIIELKNGHFVLNDGGVSDLPYLIEYLEKLTPEGEKPVIEAWFFSHAHADHVGTFSQIMTYPEYADRVYVEGVYHNMPSEKIASRFEQGALMSGKQFEMAAKFWKTKEGKKPNLYRPVSGQRYYFCDIQVEVPFSQDQLMYGQYEFAYNDTSTWLLYIIENQKVLIPGDADYGSVRAVMRYYDSSYFDLEVFVVNHHGINVWDDFTEYLSFETVLWPAKYAQSQFLTLNPTSTIAETRVKETAYIKERAVEFYAYGDGPKILTFPYVQGTTETLAPTQFE